MTNRTQKDLDLQLNSGHVGDTIVVEPGVYVVEEMVIFPAGRAYIGRDVTIVNAYGHPTLISFDQSQCPPDLALFGGSRSTMESFHWKGGFQIVGVKDK